MAAVNHEEMIQKAYLCQLVSMDTGKEDAEDIVEKHINDLIGLNDFKRDEVIKYNLAHGTSGPVDTVDLAWYVTGKYLSPLSSFIEDAKNKKTLHEPVPEAETEPAQETGTETCTDLIIDVRPGELAVIDNFQLFSESWREEMRKADFIPQAEGDLQVIRANEKKCKEIEKKIDESLQGIASYLDKALEGDPDAKRYTDNLMNLRKRLQSLKEETAAHRKNIAKMPTKWMNDQKAAAVSEHLRRVEHYANDIFVGPVAKTKDTTDVKSRLTAAYKNKRTVETVFAAVKEEADLIMSEMQERVARCNANLKLIADTGYPSLFQDRETLMVWDTGMLEQQIKIRVQNAELEKARAVRKPEELARWKRTVDGIKNIPHLENWFSAHWDEIKKSMPHEDDQAELIEYCGVRKQQLKQKHAKSVNEPPPPGDEPVGSETASTQKGKRLPVRGGGGGFYLKTGSQNPPNKEDAQSEQHEAKKGLYATFKVIVPSGDKEQANKLFPAIWKLVRDSGCIPERIEQGEIRAQGKNDSVGRLVKLLNSLSGVYDYEEDMPEEIYKKYFPDGFKIIAEGLDVDKHRWYELSTTVIDFDGGYIGIKHVSDMKGDMCIDDVEIECAFIEMEPCNVMTYRAKKDEVRDA